MDKLPQLGKQIDQIVQPTFKIYDSLLRKNADTIRSVKKETFQYGSHDRQQLDVYSPPTPNTINGRRPVLMFEYGGGLVQGHKTLPMIADGLAHANVGAFFALQHGYTVVIADYRLISHGAKFPSGGEDIALAVEWILKNQVGAGAEPIDLFIMGNSAGGMHISTFLLHPDFAETRRKISSGDGPRLRGVVMLSVPFHFRSANPNRAEILQTYYGDYDVNSVYGLLKSARQRQTPLDFVQHGTRVLVLNGELDPEDEILVPRHDFLTEWLEMKDVQSTTALAVDMMAGHNHISPPLGLSTGIAEEEAWGHQVAAFCDNVRKFRPES